MFVTKSFYLNSGLRSNLQTASPRLWLWLVLLTDWPLVCKDSSKDVRYMATFRDHLQDHHLYFRNSANRTATLKATDTTVVIVCLFITNYVFNCNISRKWRTHAGSLSKRPSRPYRGTWVQSLEPWQRRQKWGDPGAKGLYTFCATYRFVAAVYLQADVLPHLTRLYKIFQKPQVNFLHIKLQVC